MDPMHYRLASVLDSVFPDAGSNDICAAEASTFAQGQEHEKSLRENVATQEHGDYLTAVSRSHSMPVMDSEVDRFLGRMPSDALILDVGGCWGWHWRRLAETRPDVAVLIVDFVRENLVKARHVLEPLVGKQVALVHADATALPFPDAGVSFYGFDGVWTVQVFQHIPDFESACREAHRVLRRGGLFASYSLNNTPLNRFIYRLLRRNYHADGMVKDRFYLTRANDQQRRTVERIFGGNRVGERYSECLFHPDLRLTFTGRQGSRIGRVDARFSDAPWLGRWIARQRSFEVIKS